MRKANSKSRVLRTEAGRKLTIDYAILVEAFPGFEHYGISVAVRETGERVQLCGITPIASKIYALYERMVEYAVTPSCVRDVVEDWLLE